MRRGVPGAEGRGNAFGDSLLPAGFLRWAAAPYTERMDTHGTAGKQRGRPFRKGQSGNPSGRPKRSAEIRALARRHTASALAALIEIATQGSSESARVAAANALLDRGWGKPGSAPPELAVPERLEFTIRPFLSSPASSEEKPPRLPPPEDE